MHEGSWSAQCLPIEPGDLVLGQGGGDEGLLAQVLGDLDHLGLLAGEGVLVVARVVLEGVVVAVVGSGGIGNKGFSHGGCFDLSIYEGAE